MTGLPAFRLAQLPRSARLAITCFVVLIGAGYLTSVAHMYFTYAQADGKPGLTADDVRLQIAGKREKTLLEAKLVGGSMEQYLPAPAERKQVLDWIHGGAAESRFEAVHPILAQRCAGCHNEQGAAKFRPLGSFRQVSEVVQTDRGESPAAWARVAHIHLQGLATIFLALGLGFAFCRFPEWLKTVVVPLPFLALAVDFGARALTPRWPVLVYAVMGSGAAAAAGILLLCGGLLYELWLARPDNWDRMKEPTAA